MSGESELQNVLSMCPSILNADSEATVETGTTSTSPANLDSIWYLSKLAFHHPNISNMTSLPSTFTIFNQIFVNLVATPYRLLSLWEKVKPRINHHIWIATTNWLTFYVCPLTPTWYLYIWWINTRVKIIQLITTPPHLCRYCPFWGLIPLTVLFSSKAHSSEGKGLYT